jgi:hypothetical protein
MSRSDARPPHHPRAAVVRGRRRAPTAVWVLVVLGAGGCATKVTCLCRGDGGMKAARVVVRPGLTEREFTTDALESCREMCVGGGSAAMRVR